MSKAFQKQSILTTSFFDLAAKPEDVRGGAPYRVLTWEERAEDNSALKKTA